MRQSQIHPARSSLYCLTLGVLFFSLQLAMPAIVNGELAADQVTGLMTRPAVRADATSHSEARHAAAAGYHAVAVTATAGSPDRGRSGASKRNRSVFRILREDAAPSVNSDPGLFLGRIQVKRPPVTVKGRGSFVELEALGRPEISVVPAGRRRPTGASDGGSLIRPASPALARRTGIRPAKVIALTFDDGPSGAFTPQVLSILKASGAKATFFVVGRNAVKYPGLLRRIAAEGHVVGNHTYSHARLDLIPPEAVGPQILAAEKVILRATGKKPRWLRPPYGRLGSATIPTAKALGYQAIFWSVDPSDWTGAPPEVVARRVLAAARPGGVILLHDGGGNRSNTVAALPLIINGLRAAGYGLVTLDELMPSPGR